MINELHKEIHHPSRFVKKMHSKLKIMKISQSNQ
jgi:hypothetical protein